MPTTAPAARPETPRDTARETIHATLEALDASFHPDFPDQLADALHEVFDEWANLADDPNEHRLRDALTRQSFRLQRLNAERIAWENHANQQTAEREKLEETLRVLENRDSAADMVNAVLAVAWAQRNEEKSQVGWPTALHVLQLWIPEAKIHSLSFAPDGSLILGVPNREAGYLVATHFHGDAVVLPAMAAGVDSDAGPWVVDLPPAAQIKA